MKRKISNLLICVLLLSIVFSNGVVTNVLAAEKTKIVVYSPHGADMLKDLKEQFEKKYPEIEVVNASMGGHDALNKIIAEKGNPQANILFGGPQHYFHILDNEKLLVPFKPTWLADIDAKLYSNENNTFTVNFVSPVTFGINKKGMDTLPKSWAELADPKYKGKIITFGSYAASLATALSGFAYNYDAKGELDTKGKEWFQKLDENTLERAEVNVVYDKISNNTDGAAVSILVIPQWESLIAKGAQLEYSLEPTEGIIEIGDSVGIVAGTEKDKVKLEASQKYIDFIGQYDMQLYLANKYNRKPTNVKAIENADAEWMKKTYKIYDLDWKSFAPKYNEYVDLIFNQWFK